ncbi:MAG: hypothetical protein CM15mV11_0770 [Caudoviricetes sp.]|nr:MAG: hypothetical protein CM15mV11_0770 [Caudoviricetes sp.]
MDVQSSICHTRKWMYNPSIRDSRKWATIDIATIFTNATVNVATVFTNATFSLSDITTMEIGATLTGTTSNSSGVITAMDSTSVR